MNNTLLAADEQTQKIAHENTQKSYSKHDNSNNNNNITVEDASKNIEILFRSSNLAVLRQSTVCLLAASSLYFDKCVYMRIYLVDRHQIKHTELFFRFASVCCWDVMRFTTGSVNDRRKLIREFNHWWRSERDG